MPENKSIQSIPDVGGNIAVAFISEFSKIEGFDQTKKRVFAENPKYIIYIKHFY